MEILIISEYLVSRYFRSMYLKPVQYSNWVLASVGSTDSLRQDGAVQESNLDSDSPFCFTVTCLWI